MNLLNRWTQINFGAPAPRMSLGAWLNTRKMASSAYVPNRWDRSILAGSTPYSMVIPWQLDSQDTLEYQVISPSVFAWTDIESMSQQPEGFQAEFYDPRVNHALTDQPILQALVAGTGQRQFFLKRIYYLAPRGSILARIANLSTSQNQGQIVLHGFTIPIEAAA